MVIVDMVILEEGGRWRASIAQARHAAAARGSREHTRATGWRKAICAQSLRMTFLYAEINLVDEKSGTHVVAPQHGGMVADAATMHA